MTLHLHHVVNGPYVVCDECKTRINLPHNCCWGQRFIKPSLTKIGMTVKGPHICAQCRSGLAKAIRLIPQDNDEVVG